MPFNFLQTNGHCKTFNSDCIDSDMDDTKLGYYKRTRMHIRSGTYTFEFI